jgi:hypothetical protein
VDLYYLWGGRRRYRHFGFAWGGEATHFPLDTQPLEDAPQTTLRALEFPHEFERIEAAVAALPQAIELEAKELRASLLGKRMAGLVDPDSGAWLLGSLSDGGVCLLEGPPERAPALLGGWARRLRDEHGQAGPEAFIECGPQADAARAAGVRCCADSRTVPTAMFRVGRPGPLLAKLREAFAGTGIRVPLAGWSVTTEGDAFHLSAPGQARVQATLNAWELAEVIFGWGGPASFLPGPAADRAAPFAPLSLHLSRLFYL